MSIQSAPRPFVTNLPAPFDSRPWDGHAAEPSDEAQAVPTMLTEEEGRLLHWLTRDYATGVGAVCDLGCFAGGSTARLAAGILAAGRDTKVHAFDHFTLTDVQKDRYLYPAGVSPFTGNDMLPAVRQLLGPWQENLVTHPGDITQTEWHGGSIEVLFIDAAKTPFAADRIADVFFPHLIPGRSIVVHQDYLHWRQPWVPAQMELFADCFETVGWCAQNTVMFRATEAITRSRVKAASVDGLSDDAMADLIGQALCRFPARPQRAHMARAIMCLKDNPGIRLPHLMSREAFSPGKVTEVIQKTLKQACDYAQEGAARRNLHPRR